MAYNYLFKLFESNKGKKFLSVEEQNITHLQVIAEYGAVAMCLEGDLERKIPKSHESMPVESAIKFVLSVTE